jgi:hypothetical protein
MFRRNPELRADKVLAQAETPKVTMVDIDLSDFTSAPGLPDRGWLESSRELQRGLRVRETPMETLPPELIDAFFKHRR